MVDGSGLILDDNALPPRKDTGGVTEWFNEDDIIKNEMLQPPTCLTSSSSSCFGGTVLEAPRWDISSNLPPICRLLVLLSAHFLYRPLSLLHEVQNKAKKHDSAKTINIQDSRHKWLLKPSDRKTKLLMAKIQNEDRTNCIWLEKWHKKIYDMTGGRDDSRCKLYNNTGRRVDARPFQQLFNQLALWAYKKIWIKKRKSHT